MEYLIIWLQSFLSQLPWKEIAIFIGGGAGGSGVAKLIQVYYEGKNKSEQQETEAQQELRKELRGQIDDLRKRLDAAEKEVQTWREKHFKLQEEFHELKREHNDTLHEMKKMRQELKDYKNN